jgi:hypothetical protein
VTAIDVITSMGVRRIVLAYASCTHHPSHTVDGRVGVPRCSQPESGQGALCL